MSPLYSVMFVTLAVWVGLFLYLWRLDARVSEIEARLPDAAIDTPLDAPEAVLETRNAATTDTAKDSGREP